MKISKKLLLLSVIALTFKINCAKKSEGEKTASESYTPSPLVISIENHLKEVLVKGFSNISTYDAMSFDDVDASFLGPITFRRVKIKTLISNKMPKEYTSLPLQDKL